MLGQKKEKRSSTIPRTKRRRGIIHSLKVFLITFISISVLVNVLVLKHTSLLFVEQNESNEAPSNRNSIENGEESQTLNARKIAFSKIVREESETTPLSSPSSSMSFQYHAKRVFSWLVENGLTNTANALTDELMAEKQIHQTVLIPDNNTSLQKFTTNSTKSLHQRSTTRDNTDAFLTMYGAHRVQPSLEKLPSWLQDYVSKHRLDKMYKNSEKYIVLTCLQRDRCGGFSDRLRSLPFYLLFGSLSQRSICIYWDKPFGLEKFLEPPPGGLDWRCPSNFRELVNPKISSRQQRNVRNIIVGNCDKAKYKKCTEDGLKKLREIDDQFIIVHTKDQAFDKINLLNTFFLGHSYKKNFPDSGGWTHVNLIGDIFRVMFQPVESLSRRVNTTMKILGLKEKEYTSVHVRARYPTTIIGNIAARQLNISFRELDIEKSIRFEGRMKDHLIAVTNNAFYCDSILNPLPANTTPTIYICSDDNELVNHFVTHGVHISGRQTPIIPVAHQNKTGKLLHLEKDADDHAHLHFFPLVEDLLIMGGGKCVTHGVGSFGAFGAGLIGNECRALHRPFNGRPEKCPNDRVDRWAVNITVNHLLVDEKIGGEGKLNFEGIPSPWQR
mmetsp:Transcript_63384/g.74194  ORF Transcript_63384/g.74194 Transcript_63384/m.74194 type:complete len:613 (-) Transcript_63384:424-2262(-)